MKAFMNWSGGKDSALSIYKARQQGINIEALVTTIIAVTDRISMHGIRRRLLEQQAAALQLPLYTITLPEQPGMIQYETAIHQTNEMLKAKGFTHAVSGDLFLEDLKLYREQLYAKDGIACLFPLWKTDTKELMETFFKKEFKAILVCVNNSFLDKSFCGRLLDQSFINDLPDNVDVCGENGEYHSFVFDGPVFSSPVLFQKGEIVFKEYAAPILPQDNNEEYPTLPQPPAGFYFCDLLPQLNP
ncbi:MAG: diphthine--ammonia ligase [Flavisolibacter sp.]